MVRTDYYAAGRWISSAATETLPVVNPATDEVIAYISVGHLDDARRSVASARAAFDDWSRAPVADRVSALDRIRVGLEQRSEEFARLITTEMGSPLWFSRAAQAAAPIRNLNVTARAMEQLPLSEIIGNSLVERRPVGVVTAITPWNFPLHQISAKIGPALAAGCTVVLKPSEITPLDAYLLTEVIHEAGLPPGVFNLVQGRGATIGEALVTDPDVDMISFTGSTRAGIRINTLAAPLLKKVTLELGGKSASIVLEDARMSDVIPGALRQSFINSGQVCAALSRLLVPRVRLAQIQDALVQSATEWRIGDPFAADTRLGPVASRAQQSRVLDYIRAGEQQGARLLVGSARPPAEPGRGAYVAPAIFTDVVPDMTIAREEIFGPVLAVLPYDNEEHAIRLANDSDYGLSGGVWSADLDHARRVARQIWTGHVAINGTSLNAQAPFGGCKLSGFGRELGRFGLEEYFHWRTLQGAA